MKITVKSPDTNLHIRIPDFMIFNRFFFRWLTKSKDLNLSYEDLMYLYGVLKKSKAVIDGPLVEVESEDNYVKIEL